MPKTQLSEAQNSDSEALKGFLSALFAGTQDPIRLIIGDDEVDVTDKLSDALAQAGTEPVYLSSVTSTGEVPFLYAFTENETEEAWQDLIGVTPTVVMFKDGLMITAFALEVPAQVVDPGVVSLAAFMGGKLADPLVDPIPTPGANGWRMLHCDESVYTAFDDLLDVYGPGDPITDAVAMQAVYDGEEDAKALLDLGHHHDAVIRTPFDFDDPTLQRMVTVTGAGSAEAKHWRPKSLTELDTISLFCRSQERAQKDGPALVLADMAEGPRAKQAVKAIYFVGLDVDGGVPLPVVSAAFKKSGLRGVLASTHSHMKTETREPLDGVIKWMDREGLGDDITQEIIQKRLTEVKRLEPAIVAGTSFEVTTGDTGREVVITHPPIAKWRLIVALDEPYVIAENGRTDEGAREKWRQIPIELAKLLGNLPIDKTGTDPNRLFFLPSRPKGAPFHIELFGGKALNWQTLLADAQADAGSFEALLEAEVASTRKGKAVSGPFDVAWAAQRADGFQIVEVIRDFAPEMIRTTKGENAVEIMCPFDDEHSDAGNADDTACLATNADNQGFSVTCQHASCNDVHDRLAMVNRMVDLGWFTAEEAKADEYDHGDRSNETPAVRAAVVAGPVTLKEVEALASDADQDEVEAMAARIARLGSVERARATKALAKAAGIGTPEAKAMVKDAVAGAVEPPPKPAASLAPLLNAIPKPSEAHGEFTYGTFDGTPWVYEVVDDKGTSRRLYTPWGVAGRAVYMDRDMRFGLRLILLASGSRLVEVDAPAALISDDKAFRAELIARGVGLTPDGGKRAAELVAQFQPANPIEVYDRPGFRKPGQFITPWGEVISADPDAVPTIALSRSAMPKGEARSGTTQGWIDATQAAFNLGLIQLQLSGLAAFASPLIDLCDYESRTLFFSGGAGRGKSTGHLIQTSAWGDPSPKAGLFGTFDTTSNAPEVCLQQGSGAGVAFDEVKMKRGGDLQQFLFMVWSGSGKTRMDYKGSGLKETALWRCLFTASYEDPLAVKIKGDGDQIMPGLGARVLEVTVDGTEVKSELIPAVEEVKTNFGWAGPAFVRALFDQGWVDDPDSLRAEIAKKADLLLDFQRSDQRRAATTAAILWQAGEIAIEAGLLPSEFPMTPPEDVLKVSTDAEAPVVVDVDEDVTAIEAETDLERLMLHAWRNATQADSAATDTMTKAVNTLIRNLVAGRGATVAEEADGHTNRERLAFRLAQFRTSPNGKDQPVYVIPIDQVSKLAEAPVEALKIAKALEAREALVLYPRSPGQDGRQRSGERIWKSAPGIGQFRAIIVAADAIE